MTERPTEPEEERGVLDIASRSGIDTKPYTVALEIKRLLQSIVDEGTHIDSGVGLSGADLWFKVGGEEYYIHLKKSANQ